MDFTSSQVLLGTLLVCFLTFKLRKNEKTNSNYYYHHSKPHTHSRMDTTSLEADFKALSIAADKAWEDPRAMSDKIIKGIDDQTREPTVREGEETPPLPAGPSDPVESNQNQPQESGLQQEPHQPSSSFQSSNKLEESHTQTGEIFDIDSSDLQVKVGEVFSRRQDQFQGPVVPKKSKTSSLPRSLPHKPELNIGPKLRDYDHLEGVSAPEPGEGRHYYSLVTGRHNSDSDTEITDEAASSQARSHHKEFKDFRLSIDSAMRDMSDMLSRLDSRLDRLEQKGSSAELPQRRSLSPASSGSLVAPVRGLAGVVSGHRSRGDSGPSFELLEERLKENPHSPILIVQRQRLGKIVGHTLLVKFEKLVPVQRQDWKVSFFWKVLNS